MSVINYDLLKEIVSRDEMLIREELEVEDLGNFCVRAISEKAVTKYLAINTDESGYMTLIKLLPKKITYEHSNHYDASLIIKTAQSFLKNQPTVISISKKEFNIALQGVITDELALTLRETDK